MTVYARSDLAAVTISEAHGGCGETHSRPVANGAPANMWGLTCNRCEDHLRSDPLWSPTVSEIPETHDEQKAREDFDRRGAKDRDLLRDLALAKIAGLDIPETLRRQLAGIPQHIAGEMVCPSGHAQPPGMKFCGECGSPMSAPAAKAALGGPQRRTEAPAADSPPQPGFRPQRLSDARLDQLQALARQRGISEEGTRRELVDRLTGEGVSNADFRQFLAVAA